MVLYHLYNRDKDKTEEERTMKTVAANRNYSTRPQRSYPYPNAAEPGYFVDRLLDGITAMAICVGVVTVLFFLATM